MPSRTLAFQCLQEPSPFAHYEKVELRKGFVWRDMEARGNKALAFNATKDPGLSETALPDTLSPWLPGHTS